MSSLFIILHRSLAAAAAYLGGTFFLRCFSLASSLRGISCYLCEGYIFPINFRRAGESWMGVGGMGEMKERVIRVVGRLGLSYLYYVSDDFVGVPRCAQMIMR
jgi:hypothetical protein